MSEIIATYLVHDEKHNPEKKAEEIALGLTVGSWTHLPELEKQQLEKHKGRVVSVEDYTKDEEKRKQPQSLRLPIQLLISVLIYRQY